MERYKNINNSSGVKYYEIEDTYIDVIFSNCPHKYRYSYLKPGKEFVEKMKVLAVNGCGLNSFINTNVKKNFELKTII